MMAGCAEVRLALGVYVVGAIDPAERALVDQHLAVCRECRDELAGFAGLPALLGRVSLEEVERASNGVRPEESAPPARLLDSMLTEMAGLQHRIKRRRNALLAAAASIVILAGAGAGAAVEAGVSNAPSTTIISEAPPPDWPSVSGRDTTTNVTATVKFHGRSWGTEVSVLVGGGLRDGTPCQVWVTDSSGQRQSAGAWLYQDNTWYPGSTFFPASTIRSFEITAHGKTVVTVPAA